MHHLFITPLVLLSALLLSACATVETNKVATQAATQAKSALTPYVFKQKFKIEAAQLLQNDAFLTGADAIVATKKEGLMVVNKAGEPLSQLSGYYTSVDHRLSNAGLLVATIEGNRQQAMVATLQAGSKAWNALYIPKPRFKIENVCLYRDQANNAFVFLVGEEGLGEQWLAAHHNTLVAEPRLVRALSLPPASQFCQVDDVSETLYVNEENVGVWAYAANTEADLVRKPIAMVQPFGDIAKSVAGMAVMPNGLLVLDAASKTLHRYALNDDAVVAEPALKLTNLTEPENLSVRTNSNGLEVLIQDDTKAYLTNIAAFNAVISSHKNQLPIIEVQVQTDVVPSLGDAADDPAIWINPNDATQSRVIATDKQGGLMVYDLNGKELQNLRVGRLNNVDIRAGFNLNGKVIDLAVASNRDHNSLHLFAIDRANGQVSELGEQPTTIEDMYGMCLFKDKQNRFYAITNDKNGRFVQYDLTVFDRHILAKPVREFKVASQPEACVVNDETEQLFVGEEDVAVWALSARADAATTMTKVIGVGDIAHDDIEGIAYYKNKANKPDYLVVSSQGNDSYVVVEAAAPYKVRGAFRLGLNATLGIDGASETDGLEVTSHNLSGKTGSIWQDGMLVVQDGRKRMPEGNQNYKYVPWSAIVKTLQLD